MTNLSGILFAIAAFIVGAAVGSFLSVVLHRLRKQQSGVFLGRSLCIHCNTQLAPRDLIPLISYFLLGRKCRYCRKDISVTYFLLEAVTGLAFFSLAVVYNPIATGAFSMGILLELLLWFFYASLLIAIFFYDLKYMEIPDILLALGIGVSVLIAIHKPHLLQTFWAIAVPIVLFGGQILISKGKWLGEGDFYLGVFMGLVLGFPNIVIAILAAYICGTIVAIILLATKQATAASKIPFGPFLVVGTFVALFFGDVMMALWKQIA